MSWSCSLALVEEFKRQGCLVTASYARLKEIRSAEKSSWLDRKTGQSRPSPSGTTPEPLTVSLGVAPLMSCLVGSRVSPSAKQGNKKQSTTSETSGQIPSESFARYDRESFSWKMSPDLFGSTCPVSWETWPKQGTIVNGVCWERETSELHTSASGSGSWLATPTATANQLCPSMIQKHPGCQNMLPTPTAQPYGSNSGGQNPGPKRHSLQSMARHNLWPTPRATDGTKGGPNQRGSKGDLALPSAVIKYGKWPTPTANEDAAGTPNGKMQPMLGNHPGVRGTTPEEWSRGSLNPLWVEWLMGWPIGWTNLEPLETGKCLSATLQPGDC